MSRIYAKHWVEKKWQRDDFVIFKHPYYLIGGNISIGKNSNAQKKLTRKKQFITRVSV